MYFVRQFSKLEFFNCSVRRGKMLTGGLLLSLLVLVPSQAFSATLNAVALKSGRIRLSRDGVHSTLDLSDSISGCLSVYDSLRDLHDEKKHTDVTQFDLISASVKSGITYAVVAARSSPNCSLNGRCGAGINWDLIWLKLNERLQILQKEAVQIESCYDPVITIENQGADPDHPVRMKGGILKVEYSVYPQEDQKECQLKTLVYKEKEAAKGFQVRMESKPLDDETGCEWGTKVARPPVLKKSAAPCQQ